jgi:hypothetical protein
VVGGEVMQLIDLFGDTGLPPSIFACAVRRPRRSKDRERKYKQRALVIF